MQVWESRVRFKCPKCERQVDQMLAVPEPDYTAEKTSEMMSDDVIEVPCPHCGEEFAGYVFASPFECSITLDEYPDTNIHADTPSYSEPDDAWEDYTPPDRPYSIFAQSHMQLQQLLNDKGSATDGTDLVNRMVFAQYIGALEAFLADALLNAIEDNTEALNQLVNQNSDLKRQSVTLAEVNETPDLVKIRVRKYLRDVRWHNLAKADTLYKMALKIDLFGILKDPRKDLLFQAILHRHDCVHRNGYDVAGNQLQVFTKDYVNEVAKVVEFIVSSVEGHITFGNQPILP